MIISLDFETYYSTEYSLSRMSEVDYILDPRFEVICCSFKIGKQRAYCIWNDDNAVGREIDRLEALYGWDAVAMLAQNTRFDGAILFWHYGKKPKLYLDTMGMAKATTHPIIGRSSLKKLAEYFGLPPKGEEVVMARGLSRAMFSPAQKIGYMGYCDHDNELCYAICEIQMRRFPVSEIFLIDWTLRMFIEPAVRLDASKLAVHLGWVRAEKEAIFARVAHIDKTVFSSQAKFAALLEEQGIEIPTKISPATGEEIYALAKGDAEFKDLCADESQTPYVQALLACRINAKSTIEETRTEKLLNLSLREWVDCPGWMPVPLRYYGAHTGRFSGDGGFNFQNLRRKSRLKEAIEAPPGYRILHRDASQIEARMVAFLAQCHVLLRAFERGEDVYSLFATSVYGRRITKADEGERFVGKTSILGLGYGMGPPRFKHTLHIGNGGMSIVIEDDESRRIVYLYRSDYKEIPALWGNAGAVLDSMVALAAPADGTSASNRQIGVPKIPAVEFSHDAIWLPNGMPIAYPEIQRRVSIGNNGQPNKEIMYKGPYGYKRLFGGKTIENISQALARIVVTDTVLRVKKEAQLLPFMTTHDSLDYLVPEENVREFDAYLDHQFSIRPSWGPTLPLASDGGWGRTLAEAEAKANV